MTNWKHMDWINNIFGTIKFSAWRYWFRPEVKLPQRQLETFSCLRHHHVTSTSKVISHHWYRIMALTACNCILAPALCILLCLTYHRTPRAHTSCTFRSNQAMNGLQYVNSLKYIGASEVSHPPSIHGTGQSRMHLPRPLYHPFK